MDNKEVVSTINDVIETCRDGEQGFQQCAEHATGPTLKAAFERHAHECAAAATELASLVVQYGGDPVTHGTAAGALHRGWVTIVDAMSSRSDQGLLNEAERGEDSALARYRKALKDDLPADVRDMLARQMQGAQATTTRSKRCETSTKPARRRSTSCHEATNSSPTGAAPGAS